MILNGYAIFSRFNLGSAESLLIVIAMQIHDTVFDDSISSASFSVGA